MSRFSGRQKSVVEEVAEAVCVTALRYKVGESDLLSLNHAKKRVWARPYP